MTCPRCKYAERERDSFRQALRGFVRGTVMVGEGENAGRVAVLVDERVLQKARSLLAGERVG